MTINQRGMNFSPDDFNAINIYVRMGSEGRSVVLPYIELMKDVIAITGETLFKEDKIVAKADNQGRGDF